jgi:hypothetical protein
VLLKDKLKAERQARLGRWQQAAARAKRQVKPKAPQQEVRVNHKLLPAERLAQETEFLREREAVLETLRHGSLLAKANGGTDRPEFVVWVLIQDATSIIARIRNREAQWLTSGDRCKWPEIVRRWKELWEIELTRLLHGMSEYDSAPTRLAEPSDLEVSRMMVTLSLFRFIKSRDPRRFKTCLLVLASGAPTSRVAAMWRPGQKIDRHMVYDLRVRACNQIVSELLAEYGIRWQGKGFQV